MTSSLSPVNDALVDALNITNGAIYGYGVVASYADASRREWIHEALAAHRAYRESLDAELRDGGIDPPAAAIGYSLPFPVQDPVSAAQLALRIEEDSASGWLALLERAETGDTKRQVIDILAETAIRAARWRNALVIVPATVSFPGQPL